MIPMCDEHLLLLEKLLTAEEKFEERSMAFRNVLPSGPISCLQQLRQEFLDAGQDFQAAVEALHQHRTEHDCGIV